jgi:hypothetical protein
MILIVHSSYKSGVYINKFTCAIFLKFESKKLKKEHISLITWITSKVYYYCYYDN